MADKKISQLSNASTPLAGTETLPIVQSSTTVKVTVDNLTVKNLRSNATTGILQVVGPAAAATRVMTVPDANFTAARTDAANSFTGDQTLSTGNLVIGTSGKGIDFSATASAAGMTSELLTDYEEGTWTPTGGGVTFSTALGRYTKVGRVVHASGYVVFPSTVDASLAIAFGMPFTPENTDGAVGNCTIGSSDYASPLYGRVVANLPRFYFIAVGGALLTNADLSTRTIAFGATYNI